MKTSFEVGYFIRQIMFYLFLLSLQFSFSKKSLIFKV